MRQVLNRAHLEWGERCLAVGRDDSLRCPKCRVVMRRGWIRKVAVEICPECEGIFLDRGELELLQHQGEKRS